MSQVSLHDSSKICESVGGESKLSTNPIKTRSVKRTSSNGKKIHRVLTPIPTKSKQFDKLFIDTSTKSTKQLPEHVQMIKWSREFLHQNHLRCYHQ